MGDVHNVPPRIHLTVPDLYRLLSIDTEIILLSSIAAVQPDSPPYDRDLDSEPTALLSENFSDGCISCITSAIACKTNIPGRVYPRLQHWLHVP